MRIGRPLLRLPVHFCAETLAREIKSLPADAWMRHPQGFDGNLAVPLVSPGGRATDEAFGAMGPTDALRRCPYILKIMQALDSTWGRSRLMALEPGAEVPEHVDIHYYWRTHLRIHIPIITNPSVEFTCNGETIRMAPGECWILDSFYRHSVANKGSETRIHLVLDTVGSGRLWDLIDAANSDSEESIVEPGDTAVRPLDFEQINFPAIMSPWEMKAHIAYLADWTDDLPGVDQVMRILDRFVMAWTGSWARYGISEQGLDVYFQQLCDVRAEFAGTDIPDVRMRNGRPLLDSVERFIFANAIAPVIVERLQERAAAASPSRMTA